MPSRILMLVLAGALAAPAGPAPDEGLWPFSNLPVAALKARHGVAPSKETLDLLQHATLKFPGGTGAFVSRQGLVLTNQHVARRWIQQISSPEEDLVAQGFTAASRAMERPLPGLSVLSLESMVNVTERVNRAIKPDLNEREALRAKRVAFAALTKELQERTHLVCEPVTFYGNAEFWIYGYRRFTDVRLVWTPEQQIAYFGGDHDNFTFPRFDLDACLLRVYDQGKPLEPSHFLPPAPGAPEPHSLTFVAGHPGKTQRRETYAQLRFARDVALPSRIRSQERLLAALNAYGSQSPEHHRRVLAQTASVQNSLKRSQAWLRGLEDAGAMETLRRREQVLRQSLSKNPKLKSTLPSFLNIEQALSRYQTRYEEAQTVGTGDGRLLYWALLLVRLGTEQDKPSSERLPEFQDAYLPDILNTLQTPTPINMDLERALLIHHFRQTVKALPSGNPFRQGALGCRTPEQATDAALQGTRLQDPEFRKALLQGGPSAIRRSKDPMLQLARRIDPACRALRSWLDQEVHAPFVEHLARINRARFALEGHNLYPDANGTLRLSFGTIAPFSQRGAQIPPFTSYAGLFDRADGWASRSDQDSPWRLPARWTARRNRLDLSVPLNFVHKADVVGGSSGSPVVNTRGEMLGLLFDGNLESLTGNFYYDEGAQRAISVDLRAIFEALSTIYDADHLVEEWKSPLRCTATSASLLDELPRLIAQLPRRTRSKSIR